MKKLIDKFTRWGVFLSFGLLPKTLVSFLIVGSLGVLVHLCVLKFSLAFLTNQFKYANIVAMLVAASFNYFLNNKSTFSENSLIGRRAFWGYFFYIAINGIGMLISLGVSTEVFASNHVPIIAALCGIIAGSLCNYFLSYAFVWKFLSVKQKTTV